MVEPLEDTRSELTFVTELVSSSLSNVLSSATGGRRAERHRPPGAEPTGEVDLDEVEIQKGTLQVAKGLAFLHQQARMVHLNLSPDAILINAKVRGMFNRAGRRMANRLAVGRLEAVRSELDDTSDPAGWDANEVHLS
jgi:serine/threonine protein kinase